MARYKFLITGVCFALASVYTISTLQLPLNGIDDANIFFVYARNLAHGYGIVFFPNTQPVEGVTSLLWLFIITPVFIINRKPELLIVIFDIVLLGAGLAFFLDSVDVAFGKQRSFFTIFSAIGLFWSFASPIYLMWSVLSLMDIGLWSTVLLCEAGLLLRIYASPSLELTKHIKLGSAAFLLAAVWTRPEGIVWSGLFVGFLLLRDWIWCNNFRQSIQRNLLYIFLWVTNIAGITTFRLVYFGFPLPNTFYAKVAPSLNYNLQQGFTYFKDYIFSTWLLIFIVTLLVVVTFIGCVSLFNRLKNRDNDHQAVVILPVLVLSLFSLATPILTGGDHFKYFRFFQPSWPILALPLIWLVDSGIRFGKIKSRWVLGLAGIVLLFCLFWNTQPSWINFKQAGRIAWEYQVTQLGRTWGKALNKVFAVQTAYPKVGEIAVGGLSYQYHGEVVDLMGLNNVEMAHSEGNRQGFKNHAAFNKTVFYHQVPELLLPRVYDQNTLPADFKGCGNTVFQEALKNLLCEQKFTRQYRLVSFPVQSDPAKFLFVFVRQDYLKVLKEQHMQLTVLSNN